MIIIIAIIQIEIVLKQACGLMEVKWSLQVAHSFFHLILFQLFFVVNRLEDNVNDNNDELTSIHNHRKGLECMSVCLPVCIQESINSHPVAVAT